MSKLPVRMELKQLYGISFIEGGVVMVTEIAGAKLLTPFFGASLYSWASTLSITLLALMCGYYAGGYVTTKPRFSSPDKILWVFFTSGLTVLLMPVISHFIMQSTITLSFFSGLIISQLFFLFAPIFLMGMISPMIIFQVTKKAEQSGRSAGNIYAVSTSGGILFTLVFGFLIIPQFGIAFPLKLLGFCVALLALLLLAKDKFIARKAPLVFLLGLSAALAFMYKSRPFSEHANMQLVHYSEGLLGELKVVDELTQSPDGRPVAIRKLRANNVQQNFVFRDLPSQSLLYYVNFTKQLIKCLPGKKSALLIGLGAGSLYSVLSKEQIPVESVEIDPRIYDIGVNYFEMPDHKSSNAITDGRYFINATNKTYDLIILDVIIGESVPGQLITLESFERLYRLLSPKGTLIVEHGGVNSFVGNRFVPSVAKTLGAAGFEVLTFNPARSNTHGDVLFVATKNKFDIGNSSIADDVLIKGGPLADYVLPLTAFDNSRAGIFTDDKNDADLLLKEHYFTVRKGIRKELAKLGK